MSTSNGAIQVLHVDDEPSFGEMVGTFLEREDKRITVRSVSDPADGLEMLAVHGIDCIVSDYDMPQQNGIEFLEDVREHYPELPFILYTGKGSEKVASKAISKGVTDYLRKDSGVDHYQLLTNRITNAVEQTEQLRQRERELQREQAFIEQSLDTLDDIFYAVDTEGHFQRWNEALPELTGYTDEEIGSMNALEFFEGEHHTAIENSIREILETGFHATEADITTADGRSVPHEFRGVRMTDDTGDPIGIIGIARDITERKKREEELERQRSLLEAQLEATLDGILIVDTGGEVITYNQQFVELWQIPEHVVESYSDDELIDWVADNQLNNPEAFRERVQHLYDNPRERSRDEIELNDGRVFERFSAPVVGDNGTYYGRTWLFRDITDLKERERQLERERDRLDEFASIVSHDLRSPLSVATGRLELAQESYDSEHLDSIENALDRMERIIEDVLWLAREGRDIGSTEEVDLTEVIETAWMFVADDRDGVELVVSERDSPPQLIADPDRLAQLAENVLRNAIEHGGEGVTVTVGHLEGGFYIEDDGTGISDKSHEDVFATGYSTSQDGIGVGLSIVKQIVDAHGWAIRVTEGIDGGARFEITGVDVVA